MHELKVSFKDRIKQLFCEHNSHTTSENTFEQDGYEYTFTSCWCNDCKTGYEYHDKRWVGKTS